MAITTNTWNNLKFVASNAIGSMAFHLNPGEKSVLEYRAHCGYKSIAVHLAKTLAIQTAHQEVKQLLANKRLNLERSMRDKMVEQQKERRKVKIIDKQEKQNTGFGRIVVKDVNGITHSVYAKDVLLRPVYDALILSYDGDEEYTVRDVNIETQATNEGGEEATALKTPTKDDETGFSTKTMFHIDLAPQISMSSSKNIVMTTVQGRDFTRKELVSGGDLTFNVKGELNSNVPGVYPSTAVKKLLKIMTRNTIINVINPVFNNLNVKRIIIKDFSLDSLTYKNIQPYSFSCVAVEPDDIVRINEDVISEIDTELQMSEINKWYKLILENKLAEMAAKTVTNIASNVVVESTALGLDKLLPNI